VFYTRHIDGPYYFVPFASCYRMIIGMDKNEEIATIFPMLNQSVAAQKGDVLAFDFHREVSISHGMKQSGIGWGVWGWGGGGVDGGGGGCTPFVIPSTERICVEVLALGWTCACSCLDSQKKQASTPNGHASEARAAYSSVVLALCVLCVHGSEHVTGL
jgi:hypothetical protein